jgi:hypothetical protein
LRKQSPKVAASQNPQPSNNGPDVSATGEKFPDFDAGFEARQEGKPVTDNPHPPGSKEAVEWAEGWEDLDERAPKGARGRVSWLVECLKGKARPMHVRFAASPRKTRHWMVCEPLGQRDQTPCLFDEETALRRGDPPRCIRHGALLFSARHLDGFSREEARRRLDVE